MLMSSVVLFFRTMGIAIVISLVMFTLIHIEQAFRSAPETHTPSAPYVSVLAPAYNPSTAHWWNEIIETMRVGN